ncbi:MAG: carbohydrate porin [Caulobacteraceae bacterium]
MRARRKGRLAVGLAAAALLLCGPAFADDAPSGSDAQDASQSAPQTFAIHAQTTFVLQDYGPIRSPYQGPQSLPAGGEGRETWDVTLYAGARPWKGAEIWVNPEIDQGFGLDDTLGIAAFPNGEGYKIGKVDPYLQLHRLFLRQTIDLGGKSSKVSPDLNQLGGSQTENRVVITIGKFAVTDVFDANDYAHDPRHDFLNWAVIDAGTFDYAADAWGYTVGGAVEWYQGGWTFRLGVFDLSIVPNNIELDRSFGQFQWIGEVERRWKLGGHAGSLKLTGFLTRARQARFADALALAALTGGPPQLAAVRRYRSRGGASFDLQQEVSGEVGLFARGGADDGSIEPYEFADIDRTLSGGISIKGKAWGQKDDAIGVAGVVDHISPIHQAYFAAGGLGILIGDGRLPHPADEKVLEAYYDHAFKAWLHAALDYQFVADPAYNADRGPASIFALRLHAQF